MLSCFDSLMGLLRNPGARTEDAVEVHSLSTGAGINHSAQCVSSSHTHRRVIDILKRSLLNGTASAGIVSTGIVFALAALISTVIASDSASAQETFSAQDKRTIVSSFISSAARLDANDMHSHLTGLMGLIPSSRRSPLFDFKLDSKTDDAPSSTNESQKSSKSGSNQAGKSSAANRNRERHAYEAYLRRRAEWQRRYRTLRQKSRSAGFNMDYDQPTEVNPLGSVYGLTGSLRPTVTYDLNSARKAAAVQLGLADDGETKPANRFNAWVSANTQPSFTPNTVPGGQDRSGRWSFSTGAQYKLVPDVTIGALFRTRSALGNATGLSSTTDLRGVGVGVYSGVNLTPNVALSTLAFYEHGDNLVSVDGARGEYTSDHISVSTNLKGFWRKENWWFSPSASLTWSNISASSFTDTGGTDIRGSSNHTAHASFGPQVGYVYYGTEYVKAIRPHLAFSGVYTFLETRSQDLTIGSISGVNGFYGQLAGGIDVWLNNRMTMNFDVGYDGLGTDDVSAWSLQSRVNIPLN